MIALITLAVASPWAFGGAATWADRPIAILVVLSALIALTGEILRGRGSRPMIALWPFIGLLLLAGLQLVPLPEAAHFLLAPGSARLWHPENPFVADVLGLGPKPLSLAPRATSAWIVRAGGLCCLSLLAAVALRKRGIALVATTTLAISGFVVATYGIVARMAFGPLLYGRIPVPTVSPFGPFVNKNHFSGYVEMAALLALGLAVGLADELRRTASWLGWLESRRSWKVLFAFGLSSVMMLAILVSLSRGGVVSLTIGVVFLIALYQSPRRDRKRRLVISAGAILLLGIAVSFMLPGAARDRVVSLAGIMKDASGSFRIRTWSDSVRMAAASPLLGHGFGAYADTFTSYKTETVDTRVAHAENDYVELLAEGGALAVAFVLSGVFLGFRSMLSGFRGQENRLRRGIGAGAMAALVAILVHSVFDFNLRLPSNAVLCACCAALAIAMLPGSWKPVRRPALMIVSILLMVLLILSMAPRPIQRAGESEPVRYVLGQNRPLSQRVSLAEIALRRHLRRRPADAESWVMLGWTRSALGYVAAGAALARYGASLDPQRKSLAYAVDRLDEMSSDGPSLSP